MIGVRNKIWKPERNGIRNGTEYGTERNTERSDGGVAPYGV